MHDVGQVVATAQTAGTAALAVAVVVKLTRVILLAPMVAAAGLHHRLGTAADGAKRPPGGPAVRPRVRGPGGACAPPGGSPPAVLDAAAAAQDLLLGHGAVRARARPSGWASCCTPAHAALLAALASWLLIAVLGLAAAFLCSAGVTGHTRSHD